MGRISRTIELAKASWQVLKADKELVWLPVLSLVTTLIVAFSFLSPILFAEAGAETALEQAGTVEYVLLAIAYVVLAFVPSSSTPRSCPPPWSGWTVATPPSGARSAAR